MEIVINYSPSSCSKPVWVFFNPLCWTVSKKLLEAIDFHNIIIYSSKLFNIFLLKKQMMTI